MRILVYGAGVIGCELAHMLIKAGNDVTLLARGEWRFALEHNGLIIRHYAQLHTTADSVKEIGEFREDDIYDIVFVVMQYGQVKAVLPNIAQNKSRYIVMVGNNLDAAGCEKILLNSPYEKEAAFGFQATGGRRENGKVISVHVGVGMTVGGLNGKLSAEFKNRIENAFSSVKYSLKWEEHMDSWLKYHLAFILPVAYVCYATDCNLRRASKEQLEGIIDATIEAYGMLKTLGYHITDGNEDYFITRRSSCYRFLWVMAKTPIGKLAASDHCQHAVAEMKQIDSEFNALCHKAEVKMPAWDKLRAAGKPGAVGRFIL